MNYFEVALFIGMLIITVVYLTLNSQKSLQILQLEGYKNSGFLRWLKKQKRGYILRLVNLTFLSLICLFVYIMLFGQYRYFYFLGFIFYAVYQHIFLLLYLKEPKKTPLKFTPRVKRLIVLSATIFAVVVFVLSFFTMETLIRYLLISLAPILIPFVVMLSNIVLQPLERLIFNKYFKQAKQKLQGKDGLRVIGITGSYGKTSVRQILMELLETKYKVGGTIKSYNTPMGICRQINDPNETLDYDFFVAEMGARNRGDIKELCTLLEPEIAIISGLSNQHLESFKTLSNIAQTKYELIENKKQCGFSAFNCASEPLLTLYDQTISDKIASAGEMEREDFYAIFSNIITNKNGTKFSLKIGEKIVEFNTKLLAKSSVENISLCVAVAHRLGCDLDDLVAKVAQLKPVPHRLQLIETADGVVIDDAYNSNLDGAKCALEILNQFEGSKILVTPGIVELGEGAYDTNFELGRVSAGVCDFVFVLGENSKAIADGLRQNGFSEDRIKEVESLDLAVSAIAEIEGKKAILFENDLPDNY